MIAEMGENPMGTAHMADICHLSSDNVYLNTPAGKSVGIQDLEFSGNYVWDWAAGAFAMNPDIKGGSSGATALVRLVAQTTWGLPITNPPSMRTILSPSMLSEAGISPATTSRAAWLAVRKALGLSQVIN